MLKVSVPAGLDENEPQPLPTDHRPKKRRRRAPKKPEVLTAVTALREKMREANRERMAVLREMDKDQREASQGLVDVLRRLAS